MKGILSVQFRHKESDQKNEVSHCKYLGSASSLCSTRDVNNYEQRHSDLTKSVELDNQLGSMSSQAQQSAHLINRVSSK
jgi:hypothetical protein